MSKKFIIIALVFAMCLFAGAAYTQTTPSTTFVDIENHWAKEDIEAVYKKGIMVGISKNQFNPNGTVTQEELAAALTRLFELNKDQIKDPALANIFDEPQKNATRIVAASAICKSFMVKELPVFTTLMWPVFLDTDTLNDDQFSALSFIYNSSIMRGYDTQEFKPHNSITRAELAVILNRTASTIEIAKQDIEMFEIDEDVQEDQSLSQPTERLIN